MPGFKWIKSLNGNSDISHPRKLRLAPSLAVKENDLLIFSAGKLAFLTAAVMPQFRALEDKTSGANDVAELRVQRVLPMQDIFEVPLTPVVNGTFCNTNTNKKQVKVALADGSPDDLNGAIVYIVELNEWRVILDSAYSSNVVTIDVNEDFTEAPTTTHRAYVFNIGFGTDTLKADATTPQRAIGNARADALGGKFVVYDIFPKEKLLHVMFKA